MLFIKLEIFFTINHNGYNSKLGLIVIHLVSFLVLLLIENSKVLSKIMMILEDAGTSHERGEQLCIITLRIREI